MKYAAKLLTQSDLTLFEAFFRQNSTSKQKGVNLNGSVLAGQLYPALPSEIAGTFEQPVALDIYGPDAAPLHRVRRKIIKPEGGKNWRLNGKLVESPRDQPARYSTLAKHDLAIFAFDGVRFPDAVSMVVLSGSSPQDAPLATTIRDTLELKPGPGSMVALKPAQLAAFAAAAPTGHPLHLLLPDAARDMDLTEAAAGNQEAAERLNRRARTGATRPVSAAELEAARVRAQEVGRAGEVLVNRHLEQSLSAGEISGFEWVSESNAVSPFDFTVEASGGIQHWDAKSTTGKFADPFHVSVAELQAATEFADYRIARVYGIDTPAGARMSLSGPFRMLADEVRAALAGLPVGVRVSSVQIDPARLSWATEEELPAADAEDEDET